VINGIIPAIFLNNERKFEINKKNKIAGEKGDRQLFQKAKK
jgi:hypothetical protein